jgi:hypothetical protein
MDEMTQHGAIGRAAMKAGMDRKTARTYVATGTLPSSMPTARPWRTRDDPFEKQAERIEQLLGEQPRIEAKTLFAVLCTEFPGMFHEGQLRTLQRRVERWHVAHDDGTALAMLGQRHRPGEAAQTDFTSTTELAIRLAGVLYAHLLGVFVLPFSNWMWITVCLSESTLSIRRTVQRALFQLGHVPQFHQTDNSTGATHQIKKSDEGTRRKRPFNDDYEALMRHYGMTPRTIAVGESQQNGDVEAINGASKRAIEQALLVRGNRDFESLEQYQHFLDELCRARNKSRGPRVTLEIEAMRLLTVDKLVEFVEERVKVSCWGTLCVRKNTYSVPPRLIGQTLRVRLYEERIEAYFGERCELVCERLRGEGKRRIDYRHMAWSLLRKPNGFERYIYREEMFPTTAFRRAFDALSVSQQGLARDREYLRILHLAASTMQSDVEAALDLLFEQFEPLTYERVKELADARRRPPLPTLAPMKPQLAEYDALIAAVSA